MKQVRPMGLLVITLVMTGAGLAWWLLAQSQNATTVKYDEHLRGPQSPVTLRSRSEDAEPPPSLDNHVRRLVVVEVGTQSAIPEARITSQDERTVIRPEEKEGVFALRTPLSIVELQVEAAGYLAAKRVISVVEESDALIALMRATPLRLEVRQSMTMAPVANARVALVRDGATCWQSVTSAAGFALCDPASFSAPLTAEALAGSRWQVEAAGLLPVSVPVGEWRGGARLILTAPSNTMSVHVVAHDSGVPVSGATVLSIPSDSRMAVPDVLGSGVTGPDGECTVAVGSVLNVLPRWRLLVSASGYHTTCAVGSMVVKPVTVRLVTASEAGVRLVDSDGAPVVGTTVEFRARAPSSAGGPRVSMIAVSDEKGVATVRDLVQGTLYWIRVRRSEQWICSFDLSAEALLDFPVLNLPSVRSVQISVCDMDETPIPDCRLYMLDPFEAARAQLFLSGGVAGARQDPLGTTDAAGKAEILLPGAEDEQILIAVAHGHAPVAAPVAPDADVVHVQLEGGVRLVVEVVDIRGQPVQAARVSLDASAHPLRAPGIEVPSLAVQSLRQTALTGEDGTVEMVAYSTRQSLYARFGLSEVGPRMLSERDLLNGHCRVVLRALEEVRLQIVDEQGSPIPNVGVASRIEHVNAVVDQPVAADALGHVNVWLPVDGSPRELIDLVFFGSAVGSVRASLGDLSDGARVVARRVQMRPLSLTVQGPGADLGDSEVWPVTITRAGSRSPVSSLLARAGERIEVPVPALTDLDVWVGSEQGPPYVQSIGKRRSVVVAVPTREEVCIRNDSLVAAELLFVARSGRGWVAPIVPPRSEQTVKLEVLPDPYTVVDRQLHTDIRPMVRLLPGEHRGIRILERAMVVE